MATSSYQQPSSEMKIRKMEGSRLPEDIIFSILLRVSVKNLYKFQCVCKSWQAMIFDPFFRKLHVETNRLHSQQNPLLFEASKYKSLDFKGEQSYMLNTCLELVCIYSEKFMYVCNPTTHEILALPKNSSRGSSGYLRRSRDVGIGYVPTTNQYKVVRVNDGYCDVFTIGTDRKKWRTAPDPPFSLGNLPVATGLGTFVNGAIYMYNKIDRIARFNLEKEEWSVVPSPPGMLPESYLCELRGFLSVTMRRNPDSNLIDIWMLKDCEKFVWAKEYTLEVHQSGRFVVPLLMETDRWLLIYISGPCGEEKRWVYFDWERKFCREMVDPPEDGRHNYFSRYVESFYSLS